MMNDRFLIICNAYPKEYDEYYLKLSGCDTTTSSVIFSNSIIKGVKMNEFSYDAISAASVGHYPFTTKTKRLKSVKYDNHFHGVGYSNSILSSQTSKAKSIYNQFASLGYDKDEKIDIVVADVHTPFLRAALKIKKQWKNSRIVLICLDLPQFVKSSSKNILLRLLKKFSVKQVTKLSLKVDGYVYLSKQMKEQFGNIEKPSVVIPTILDTSIYDGCKKEKHDTTNFVYCGVLSKQYNADLLLDAFSCLHNENYRLILAGKGDMVDEIKLRINKDNRIQYLGEVSREQAYQLQFNADVLVNPRLPSSEYTSLSFPSKTTSYLYSGNPFVCYSMQSFPDDIKKLVFEPSGETPKELASAMEQAIDSHNDNQIKDVLAYSERNAALKLSDLFSEIRKNDK